MGFSPLGSTFVHFSPLEGEVELNWAPLGFSPIFSTGLFSILFHFSLLEVEGELSWAPLGFTPL